MKMKILHIISGGDKGGAKTHMFALLDELCKLADVTVVCLVRGVFYEEIIKRPVNTVLVEQKNRLDFTVVSRLAKLVADGGFDIINSHGARANFIAAMLKKKVAIPVVTTIHSDYLLDFDSFYKKLVFERMNIRALKKINYKIAVSDAFRDMLISRGFMPNDIQTVYNGMDFSQPCTPVSREEFAARHGIPYDPETVYIGIAARFDHVKGVDVFIRAAAEVKKAGVKARFIIAGEGDEAAELAALADSLRVSDITHFIGFVSPIYDFLGFIDINTLTSRSESFPYSILEGAKAKKPTVAAYAGGIPHLIEDGENGFLFEPEDYRGCAEKLVQLCRSALLREKFGQAIYGKASHDFSNLALAKSYLANYERFITKYHRANRYDILLSGYYGFGNFGDDIILSTILDAVKKARPECEVLALSRHPHTTMKTLRVDAVNRYSLKRIRRAIRSSRAYVNGGGTLLTDVTSTRSLIYYTALIGMAKRNGLRTMVLANGIGPFRRKENMRRAVGALQKVDTITVRDKNAYDFVTGNVPGKTPVLSADITLLNKPGETASPEGVKKRLGIKGDYIIVALREPAHRESGFEQTVAEACDAICAEYGITAVFMPMQYEKDVGICRSAASRMKQGAIVIPEAENKPDDIIKLISGARMTLGMRLHSLVFSAACGVPLVGIAYDVKVSNFVTENDIGVCFEPSALNKAELTAAVRNALAQSSRGDESPQMQALRKRAEESISLLCEIIDE